MNLLAHHLQAYHHPAHLLAYLVEKWVVVEQENNPKNPKNLENLENLENQAEDVKKEIE